MATTQLLNSIHYGCGISQCHPNHFQGATTEGGPESTGAHHKPRPPQPYIRAHALGVLPEWLNHTSLTIHHSNMNLGKHEVSRNL